MILPLRFVFCLSQQITMNIHAEHYITENLFPPTEMCDEHVPALTTAEVD